MNKIITFTPERNIVKLCLIEVKVSSIRPTVTYLFRNILNNSYSIIGPKKQYIPNWYQIQAQIMEKRVEEIESSVRSLAEGQQTIVNQINDLFSQLKVCIDEVSKRGNDGESSNNRGRGPRYGPNANYTAKPLKLDFPRFNGKEDPTSWVCRAEQFFRFHSTPAEERVSIASFHLEDDAQLWFQVLIQEMPDATWDQFKEGIYATYGPRQFLDYFGELTKLKQDGTVQSYQSQFNKLLAKVGHLPQDRQVSCFLSGLSDTIRTEVQANCPTNLSTAISLARLYEAKNQSQQKPPTEKSTNHPIKHQTTSTMSRLTIDELNERKKLGLCFRCNEQFAPGHKCKKLFAIQAIMNSSDDDEDMEIEPT